MKASSDKILAVLPAYNEVGKIGNVIQKIKAVNAVDAILTVDDFSTDATSDEARLAGSEVVRHEFNRGVGAAIRTGIQYSIDNQYKICVILSGDDQHEPKELPRILEPVLSGEYDFIQGSRRLPGGRIVNGTLFRRISTWLYSILFSLLTFRRITDATNGFRAFRLSIFNDSEIDINQDWLDRYELEPYILFKAVKSKNVKLKEIPITIYYHIDGRKYTKMKPFKDWWRLAKPMVYLGLGIRK
ncbi:MAG: glycosyltransferase family 2 protein [Candidatus Zixiibacteriota bacterium]